MERLLDFHQRLKDGRYPNCSSFSADWEVSVKTVQRDIDFLRDRMGAPVEYDSQRRGYYYTDETFMMPALTMSEGELAALLIGSKALEQYRNTPMAKKLETVFQKLAGLLPEPISLRPEQLYCSFTFTAPPALPIKNEIWTKTVRGLLQQRMLEIRYRSRDNTARVIPLHLANLQGDWYLFVQYEGFDNFRQLALSRILSVKLLRGRISPSRPFDVAKEIGESFSRFAGDNAPFEVKLRFDKEAADEVTARQWHPNQKMRRLKNGSVELIFQAKGWVEVMRWALARGRHCKVVSPAWFKKRVTEEIEAMK